MLFHRVVAFFYFASMSIVANFHSHTNLCHHAKGTVADYAEVAQAAGLKYLGVADHTPRPDNKHGKSRMKMNEFDRYIQQITWAKSHYPELDIYTGLECEHAPHLLRFYRELLDSGKIDYVIGSVHYLRQNDRDVSVYKAVQGFSDFCNYFQQAEQIVTEKTYSFLAHPDLFAAGYLRWGEQEQSVVDRFLQTTASCNAILEMNASGFIKPHVQTEIGLRPMYPFAPFWEMVSNYNIQIVINSDAHAPERLLSGMNLAHNLANRLGLKVAQTPEVLGILHRA